MDSLNGYSLIREWYNFKFENPSKCKSVHSDFYCYIVYQWNKLGQKSEFGLPTSISMEALGIGSYNTYKNTLNDLIDFGFVKIVSDAKNQHQSKIIALSKNDKANDKALDKANDISNDKPTDKPTDSIYKLLNNKTIKLIKENIDLINSKKFQDFINSSKEDKQDNEIPNFDLFFHFLTEKYIELNLVAEKYRYEWKLKYDSWVVNGWKDGNGKQIKNWKQKALNTLKYIDPKEQKSQYYEMPL
jgi:hypothetical protein